MTFPFSQPIILRRRTKNGTDSFGNDVWSTTDTTVPGVFKPGTSVELVQGQDLLTVQPSVYLPPGSVVSAVDVVLVGGVAYEVDGSPNEWDSPFTGWRAGVEVKLRRVTG